MKSTAKNLVVHPSPIPLAGLIRSQKSYSLMRVILHKLLTAPVCMVFQFTRFFWCSVSNPVITKQKVLAELPITLNAHYY